jgi:glutathione S-transferase
MASATPVLWQIKVSHYNEKVRWALDYKGVAHRRRAPMPMVGTVPAAWLMTRDTTLPVLRLDGRAIRDSTAIVAALEQRWPDPPLYPADQEQRARALELEEYFDEQLAPQVRRLAFFMLGQDPRAFFLATFPDSSPLVRASLRPGAAITSKLVNRRYGITEESAKEARGKVLAAFDRLEAELGPVGYLVGDSFSIADLTAAALATPFIRPPERQYLPPEEPPEPLRSFARELAARPAGRWVLDVFRRHRGTSAEVTRRGRSRSRTAPPAAVSA